MAKVIVVPGRAVNLVVKYSGGEVIAGSRAEQVRGTQTLVNQMGWMFRHPAVVAVEVGWRWLFGVPFLLVCWTRLQHVLTVLHAGGIGSQQHQCAESVDRGGATEPMRGGNIEPLIAHELRWLAADRGACVDRDLGDWPQSCASG